MKSICITATGVEQWFTATQGYHNWFTRVAASSPIAATQVATADATGPMKLPGWRGNSHPKAYQNQPKNSPTCYAPN